MNVDALLDLADDWRREADLYRRRGLQAQAEMTESFAQDLKERVREWLLQALTLEQAAAESGYSYSSLQKRLASDELPNAGEPHRPRIRRCDLPQKGGKRSSNGGEPDLAGDLLDAKAQSQL